MGSIEHGCYLNEDPELIPMMAERGTFFVHSHVYVFHREVSAPHVRARGRDLYPHHIASLQKALAAGVKIVAGTDAGGHEHNINAQELQYLVEGPVPHAGPASRHRVGRGVPGTGGRSRHGDAWEARRPRGGGWQPLQNITVLQDVQRIKLVLKGGDVCVDRRVE